MWQPTDIPPDNKVTDHAPGGSFDGSHADPNWHWSSGLCDPNCLLPLRRKPCRKKLPPPAEEIITARRHCLDTVWKRPSSNHKAAIEQSSHAGDATATAKNNPGRRPTHLQDSFADAPAICCKLKYRCEPDVSDCLKSSAFTIKPG